MCVHQGRQIKVCVVQRGRGSRDSALASQLSVGQLLLSVRQQQGSPSPADLLQAPLRLLAEWEPAVLPYVQDLPMRIRSILLERAGDDHNSIWSELER